jgi:hypothetical protein
MIGFSARECTAPNAVKRMAMDRDDEGMQTSLGNASPEDVTMLPDSDSDEARVVF